MEKCYNNSNSLAAYSTELEAKMNSTDNVVVTQARTWLGTKYHHQGRLKKTAKHTGGVDCIGLIIGIINELNICDRLDYSMSPQTTKLAEALGCHLELVATPEIKPGDILLFKFWQDPQHVGIVSDYPTGGLGLIHCNSSSGFVVEQLLSQAWKRMITHAYRFRNSYLKSSE